MKEMPKVSVIIRTCNRPSVLKNALDSIKRQTYSNIEVIVVEDGENKSEAMLQSLFSDLDIKYYATMEKKGRAVAGNIGLSMAKGDYFNFLDDDDIFYPNHAEVLLNALRESGMKAAYSIAEESRFKQISSEPYVIREKRKFVRYKQEYNKLLLFAFNYIPIQSIMFSRELYDQMGGFDPKLCLLEDWDLWVRYSVRVDFKFVPEITSKYFVEYKSRKKMERNRALEHALEPLHKKFKEYMISMNIYDINREMDYILNIYNKKSWYYYLRMIRNFILYKDI